MAMTTTIDQATGAGPAFAAVTNVNWSLNDSAEGTTPVATPTATGTAFSFVKTFQINITVTDSLTMTDVKFGKVAGEATTGTKLWYDVADAIGAYVEATAAPTSTGDNNTTAPAIPHSADNTGVVAVPLIGGASVYAAGPFSATGRQGNMVQVCCGVDATNTDAGGAVSTPTLRWQWTES